MPDVLDYEGEITRLRAEITKTEQEAVVKRTDADKLRDDIAEADPTAFRSLMPGDEGFDKIDEAYKEADGLRDMVGQMRTKLNSLYGWTGRTGPAAPPAPGRENAGPIMRDSVGRRLVASEGYLRVKELGNNRGARVNSDPIAVLSREEFRNALQPRMRAGLDLASGQSLVTPEFQLVPPVELPVRQVALLDLINVQTTDTDAVVWGQQTQRVLAAAPTASGIPAPQATLAFQRVTSNVHRIPVLLTVPKEVLADEGRLQGILDTQLMADTRLSTEAQVLAGDGSGEDFTGVLNTAGIGSTAKGGGEYDLDAIHRAITYVRLHLFQDPDAIGLHPTNLEGIMLQKDNYGRYIFDPSAEQSSIWGFDAVSSPVFTAGTGVVGNWRMGATLWLREDVVVTMTDGYTDVASGTNYFSAGLVAILAQVRAAFAVERPFAFCEVTSLV